MPYRQPAFRMPTTAELEVLRVLWERGPSAVKDVHAQLATGRTVGLTSILKTIQVMEKKELVARVGTGRPQLFCAAPTRESVELALTEDLVTRAFAGSTASLVRRAIDGGRIPREHLDEIAQLIDEARRKRGKP